MHVIMTKKGGIMKKSFWIAGAVCMLLFGEAVYAMTRTNINQNNSRTNHIVHHEEIESGHNTYHQYCNVPNCTITVNHVHNEHHTNQNNTNAHHGHGHHY